jgi:hypothetical protein
MDLVSCLSYKSRNRILNQLSTSPVNSEGTCLENTAATKFSKIFSGRQRRQSVKMFRRFRDRLCLRLSPEDVCRMNSEVHMQLHTALHCAQRSSVLTKMA